MFPVSSAAGPTHPPLSLFVAVLRMAGADEPSREPITLLSFNSKADIGRFATGCDADIGGTSSAHFALDESESTAEASGSKVARPTAKFWGEMRLAAREGYQGRVRGGYAGFRSIVCLLSLTPNLVGVMLTAETSRVRHYSGKW